MTRTAALAALDEAAKTEMENLFRVLRIGMTSRDESASEKFTIGLGSLARAHDIATAAITEKFPE